VIRAALYLSGRTLANMVRRRVQRLRQPKYLIGFCVGLLYFYWLLIRPGSGAAGRRVPLGFEDEFRALGTVLAAGGVAALALITWIFGRAETPFTFQLAETDFLFTAPLTRRQVLQFRLLRTQLPLFVSALFSVAIFFRGGLHASLALRVLGLWLLYATLQLHYAGAALVRGSFTQQGVTGVRRRLGTLAVIGALVAALWWGLRDAMPGVLTVWQDEGAGAGATALVGALHHGVLGVALWPLFAAVGPLTAPGPREFLLALPGALAVAGAHYLWVIRSTLSFEEAAVEHAGRVARRLDTLRRGRSDAALISRRGVRGGVAAPRALLPLAPTGPATTAIVWKNVTGALREFRLRTLVLIGILILAFSLAVGGQGRAGGSTADLIAVLSLSVVALVTFFGPLALRFDLRRDLELLDVLKSYPVGGHEIVAAEVLGMALVLSAVAGAGLVIAFVASLASGAAGLPPVGVRVAMLVAGLVVLPGVLTVMVLVQNAAALLFPAWMTLGAERPTGFEATGQRILTFAGTVFALFVAVLPAALVGGVAAVGVRVIGLGVVAAGLVWAVAGAALLALECAFGFRLLGPVLDRLDPAGLR
jgi:ABC-2 type transport system permease protein